MFGFEFVKFQPSDYIIQVKNGKVVKEGVGLSFYYYERASSVVVIPISSIDVSFMFEEITRDYQTVTVQGQLTYRIVDYRKMMEIMNYTYNIKKKAYISDDPVKLSQRMIQLAKVLTKKQLAQLPLKEAIQSSERLAKMIRQEISQHEELAKLGIELMGLSILAVLPNKETMRALEAQSREQMLQDADEALYVRRNSSIEQERRVKENELNTDIAVEQKKRQIREAQLDAERSVRQKQNELKEVQLQFDTQLEEKKQAMIELAAANRRSEADAKAYELAAVMKSLHDTQPYVLQAMTNMGMDSNKLIAIAFQEMAEKAERIGQLNISPDLLQSLIPGTGNGASLGKSEARGGAGR
ncbi:SPFH domain-containing protein [Paenibacillus sp. Leaf72]|uniref:SPFH domain-containing protein n=1 Tax=Paenibacillus sp. Leaf72 TaxID=1736234 RepID=UPI0006F7EFA9|nr:SPFH domain-containing protein [Paenibacillus sp. Leaf72]KQO17278.1 membrane protease subunit, stomatin/prohibitin [Paenibacillus sp. Leaf72]